MKKSIAVLLILAMMVSMCFAACKKKDGNGDDASGNATSEGIAQADNVVGFQDIEVTDKDGKAVTDKDGNKVTTEVAVLYERDKDGKTIAKVIDNKGETVTDKDGNDVTVEPEYTLPSTTKADKKKTTTTTTKKNNTTSIKPTGTTKKDDKPTEPQPEPTTSKQYPRPPKTSESGTPVAFNQEDQDIIKSMLEVPFLYISSYENSQGVPIDIATHAAIWMAKKENLSTSTYASGTIVLGLFKYFGQTVVHFKVKCNDAGNDHIVYNASDSFTISDMEDTKIQNVDITGIERFGDSEYYKVTGKVSGAKGVSSVIAIVQRNRLDRNLGFSIKALKWS